MLLNTPLDSEIKPVNDFNFCSLLEVVFFFFCFGHSILMVVYLILNRLNFRPKLLDMGRFKFMIK